MNIAENLKKIKSKLPENVVLVAVSKTKPVSVLMEAYECGQRIFGENKIQEMTSKYEAMPKDIEWHMIGHVQTNKVKYMAPYVHLVHGVDSLKLLKEINKQAAKHERVIHCLLQMHIAQEETKFGMSEEELFTVLQAVESNNLPNIYIRGLMGMASFTDNTTQIRQEFSSLKSLFDRLQDTRFSSRQIKIDILSIGMSGDYLIAVQCGSTMVRIGSSIFGKRNYD
ncbi:YggS family pyridoxal phosphate-dependent enzyme [Ascidiimonas aurantiaca]|uniref:YggS family pyridoxal phosphate-dependent enzyme n=1 Tax=Ascidiimonas aurantiaca TaxID=1685432 RepID=UPI0030EC0C06